MPTVHDVYKPTKIICWCLQAGQAQQADAKGGETSRHSDDLL